MCTCVFFAVASIIYCILLAAVQCTNGQTGTVTEQWSLGPWFSGQWWLWWWSLPSPYWWRGWIQMTRQVPPPVLKSTTWFPSQITVRSISVRGTVQMNSLSYEQTTPSCCLTELEIDRNRERQPVLTEKTNKHYIPTLHVTDVEWRIIWVGVCYSLGYRLSAHTCHPFDLPFWSSIFNFFFLP